MHLVRTYFYIIFSMKLNGFPSQKINKINFNAGLAS